ncbi:hypothetical protein [Asticcacaulis sp. AND118]|uniref:hypothetical protein n=1 Tax=Asticcacaulis sp. AND118 TaxID=2840468 RepID=UPI001CFFA7BB|nr:hypothetical protein [Asticcacaulis sp. AND118]UDF02637.1 hypothetical protein LH365_09340 [Asticcacaulis sp. AND118]
MSFTTRTGRRPIFLAVTASIMALSLAACQTDAPPPAPPPPPPAPAGPPVSLAPAISDAASVYVAYIDQARGMNADFNDPAMVQAKLSQGSAYEPKQLARGAIAYAAIVAMQEPAFRSQLRAYAADATARQELVTKLFSNPGYAGGIPGANIAARRVILALSSDGEMLYTRGAAMKQAAYSIQKQAWSKGLLNDPNARLAATKLSSSTSRGVVTDESARLLTAALTGNGLTTHANTGTATADAAAYNATSTSSNAAQPLSATGTAAASFDRETLFNTPYTYGVNRALAIAAISILGEGTGPNEAAVIALLNEQQSPRCLGESKLMLNQCLAASRFHFDDVFCTGQHILMDTGNCIGELSSNALNLSPDREVKLRADGTEELKYANAKPYIKPEPVKKASAKKPAAKKTSATAKKKTS